jgi:hypothetical protein
LEHRGLFWEAFGAAAPAIAGFATERLAGRVAYLATVRADGGPRVHPVTPIIGDGHFFLFMEPTSPKGRDLVRTRQYALHCGVEDNSGGEGEVILHGTAALVDDPELRAIAARVGYTPKDHYILFELFVEYALTTRYEGDEVVRERWRAS